MIKVSIIVPVYKTEQYIRQCIESILPCLNENTECIFIDDGSPDNSVEIIKSLLPLQQVKIIQQSNKGLSAARNNGIANAQGEYILFIDSDDWIEGDCNMLYDYAQTYNLDILAFNFKKFFEDSGRLEYITKKIPRHVMKGYEYFYFLQRKNIFSEPAQFYMYKREFLLKKELYFLEGVRHEDNEFTPRAILLADHVAYLDIPFYVYRKRENSITSTVDAKRPIDLLEIINSLDRFKRQLHNPIALEALAIYGTRFIRKILYYHALLNNKKYDTRGIKHKVVHSLFFKESVSRCSVLLLRLEGWLILHGYDLSLLFYQLYILIRDQYVRFKGCCYRKK